MMRVADYIVTYLYDLGIKDSFMVSGGGMMFLCDALKQHPNMRVICHHHEQAAAMAGIAYARYTQNLGAVFVTTGCGGTNTMTGLLGAWQDSTPCIFISGQSKRKETVRNSSLKLRQLGVQEADIISIVQPLTKYAVMVNDPAEIAFHLDKAIYMATSGRPGPVWLDIPLDIQSAVIDADSKTLKRFSPSPDSSYKEEPTEREFERFNYFLLKAKRPIIIAGQGIRLGKAISEFRSFVEQTGIPVVSSRLGIDLLPSDHPLFIGRIGNKGDRAGNFALQNSDLVISIGSRLSVSSTGHEYEKFAREANLIVIDIDPEEHKKKTLKIDFFINASTKNFLKAALKQTKFSLKEDPSWQKTCLSWKKLWPVCLKEYATDQGKGINVYYFVDRLCQKLKSDSVIISDAGSSFYVVSQTIQIKDEQRYITSAAQAEMGYSLPASIGVSIARKDREVIAVTGDGSFQMNIQELQTLVHYELPVKLFIWNNDGYLSIRATQSKFFDGRLIGTDASSGVSFPDIQKIAAAYGIKYVCISGANDVDEGIRHTLTHQGPVLCEVKCIRDQEIIPTVSSFRRPDGTLVSKPLEDMYPFLDREEFKKHMIVKPLKESL